jgi:hypothetical protein
MAATLMLEYIMVMPEASQKLSNRKAYQKPDSKEGQKEVRVGNNV